MANFKNHRVVARFMSGGFAVDEAAAITCAALLPPGARLTNNPSGYWEVQITWRYRKDEVRAEPEELLIVHGPLMDNRKPVSASLIRSLPLGTMIDESRKVLIARATEQTEAGEGHELWAKFAGLGPRRGTEVTPEQDQVAAEIYRRAWNAGDFVTQAVAEHFGVSRSAATKRIAKARAAGLLDGTRPKR